MKSLYELGVKNGTDKNIHGYLPIYARYMERLRSEPIRLLEIGIQFGLSIKMWLEYFSEGQIYGLDCIKDFTSTDPRCHLYLGDQRNPTILQTIASDAKGFDVVIDDGCHHADAQVISFTTLWPFIKPKGLYIIEDCFTWSDSHFDSTVNGYQWLTERVKDLFLHGNQYHGKPHSLPQVTLNEYEATLAFIHLYKGLVIIGQMA